MKLVKKGLLSDSRRSLLSRHISPESGQGMAEYVIVIILVAILVIAAIRLFGRSVYCNYMNASREVDSAGSGGQIEGCDAGDAG